ncbi:hypothetical protein HK099_004549 [Clydaea vesicula]|uniref:L-lactate dehydrogenase (cytochrome) n=1 Tax=Clydaea vesicula TaxID=447962 RepID=A0AAD5U3J2_9FUNG|nr:hypothetical protein HK099_004549 [Clydaea vesicula]
MFKPRVMRNVKVIDLTHRMFGKLVNLPIYITATALGKLGHPEGEVVLTKAAGTKNIIQMMPTLASCSVAEMMDNALPGQEQWFQLYVNQDRVAVKKLLEKVESRGVRVLFVTVDAPSLGKREKDMRVKFVDDAPDESKHTELNRTQGAARAISTFIDPSLCWDDVSWFKANTKMKIVLKGIQCGEDAVLAAQHGCDGIVVSNHGGRQLDTCRSGIEVLPECIAALKEAGLRDKLQVFMDGGVRRGGDIFKALALGADAVGLGRPFLYGMASYGQQGVEKVIDILAEELTMTMRMCGVTNIKDIGPEYVLANNLNSHIGVAPKGYGFSNAYERMETIDSKL